MLTHVNLGSRPYLAAARRVLDERGIASVTMRNVAREAGTTATAIYRHFADKAELLDALHRSVFAEFRERLETVAPLPKARETLMAGLAAYRDYGLENPGAFEFLFMVPHGIRTSLYPRDFREVRSPTFRLLVDTVRTCMEEGSLAEGDPTRVALGIDAQVLGLMLLYRSGRFGDDEHGFRRFFREALERQFARPQAEPRGAC
jgi:AcrR family transcriptional regulator